MNKLRIGLVFDDSLDRPDGVTQYVLTIGRWLVTQGHDVHYLVGETKRQDVPQVNSLSRTMKVRFNQNRLAMPLPASARRIRELLAREQFDVLHVQMPYSPALAGKVIKAASPQTAVVGMFHILPHSKLVTVGTHLLGRWVRATLRRFDAVMANSAPTAAFAEKTFHVKSEIVPLPVDLDRFYTAKPFPHYKTGHTIMFLGRLVERKGCQYLLRAVLHAHRKGLLPPNTRVVICGGGPLAAQLKKFVEANSLSDIVEFAGHISEADKPRYLASADVVVYPSTGGESFGIVLLEAMAASHGVVLAGNNPGYASVMAPRPASLFDPHDSAALAILIVQALTDKKLRAKASAWQRKYIHHFDVPAVGKRTLAIFKQALHKRRA